MKGRVHSLQSLGTLDGPGIRYVVFLQGCPLRCACCHNPDTWDSAAGKEYTADELLSEVIRYREYFGDKGGITLSGGEPLLQAAFAKEIFTLCQKEGIHTCLDTSGCFLNDEVKALLSVTDRVLLDLKYTDDDLYREYVGCSLQAPLAFLSYLNEQKINTTLRQVIIPTVNDTLDNVRKLKSIAEAYPCVDHIELLPFRKICQTKYDAMGFDFPFGHLPEADAETMRRLSNEI